MLFFFTDPILIAAAILPAVFLLVQVYRADTLEKEPPALIGSLLVRGVIATALAMFTEQIGTHLLDLCLSADSLIYNILLYFLVVACSEEGFKYLLLHNRTWYSPDFNCQFDGVVYATAVSLGFALWENISYVALYGFGTAMVRAVTAVPGHACFGVFMGAFYGMAKRYDHYGRPGRSLLCRWLSFLFPAFLHGWYDFIATTESSRCEWVFVVFIAVLFIIASAMVKRLSHRDQYI